MIQLPAQRMTYEEFLRAYDGRSAEWVRGEAISMSPVSWSHQEIVLFLADLVRQFLVYRRIGKLMLPPFQAKLSKAGVGREPDIMFISNERLSRVTENYLDGAPDIAVEVISPDSRARDRGEKYYEYEMEGVREYWLVDPARREAEFYALGPDGKFSPMRTDGGVFRSAVLPGFWIEVDWLWRKDFPTGPEVVKLWGLA